MSKLRGEMEKTEIENRFSFHPANTEEKKQAHETIRNLCLRAATDIKNLVPAGREQSLAITNLEQVMFWANAGIARNE
jgi:hypothetical protein